MEPEEAPAEAPAGVAPPMLAPPTLAQLNREEALVRILERELSHCQARLGIAHSTRTLPPYAWEPQRAEITWPSPGADAALAPLRQLWAANDRSAPPLVPRSARLAGSDGANGCLALSLIGLDEAAVAAQLDALVQRLHAQPGAEPLCLTDRPEHLPLARERGMQAELLPRRCLERPAALAAHLALLREQWKLAHIIELGAAVLPKPDPIAAQGAKTALPLTFFPDLRAANPYQQLLYTHMPGIDAAAGSIASACDRQEVAGSRTAVFHLHWEEHVYLRAGSEAEAAKATRQFMRAVAGFRRRGGRLVWTIHNRAPHECRFPELHRTFTADLADAADLIHLHGHAAVETMREAGLPIDSRRLIVLPHGNYDRPEQASDDQASDDPAAVRRELGIAPAMPVVGMIGQLRRYKRPDLLIEAVERLGPGRVHLLLAGRAHPAGEIESLCQNLGAEVTLRDTFHSAQELERLALAVDFLVFAAADGLCSGSLLWGLSHGLPVIVPARPAFTELIRDGENGLVYPMHDSGHDSGHDTGRDNAEALAACLDRALALSRAERQRMAEMALATAARFDWRWIGRKMAAAVTALAGQITTGR